MKKIHSSGASQKLKISARSRKFGPQINVFPCLPENVIPVNWHEYFVVPLYPLLKRG